MNDLPQRLRQWAISTDATPASDLMEAAAGEIDRLRQAMQKANNPNALLAAYQLGVRHSTEQSPSGSGSGGPINRSAPERQSPAGNRDGGLPLDDCAPTRDHAPGGRGHHTQEPVAWRVYATDGSEVVYAADEYERARDAADELNWSVEPLYRQPPTCPYVAGRTTLRCSLTPLGLTDEEREYITCQANRAWHNAEEADARGDAIWARWHREEERTLRGLLERTK